MAKVGVPVYALSAVRCPCECGGEGELTLWACPACGQLLAGCGELSAEFRFEFDAGAPSHVRVGARVEGTACPGCGAAAGTCVPARLDQIEQTGLRWEDLCFIRGWTPPD